MTWERNGPGPEIRYHSGTIVTPRAKDSDSEAQNRGAASGFSGDNEINLNVQPAASVRLDAGVVPRPPFKPRPRTRRSQPRCSRVSGPCTAAHLVRSPAATWPPKQSVRGGQYPPENQISRGCWLNDAGTRADSLANDDCGSFVNLVRG